SSSPTRWRAMRKTRSRRASTSRVKASRSPAAARSTSSWSVTRDSARPVRSIEVLEGGARQRPVAPVATEEPHAQPPRHDRAGAGDLLLQPGGETRQRRLVIRARGEQELVVFTSRESRLEGAPFPQEAPGRRIDRHRGGADDRAGFRGGAQSR